MDSRQREQFVRSLANREYRHAFVAEHIATSLAFQIRALRESRGWTQEGLAQLTGKAQGAISQLEVPNYGRYSLSTLKRLAAAFDVALTVRFTPFSELVDWIANLSPRQLAPKSFDADTLPQTATTMDNITLVGKSGDAFSINSPSRPSWPYLAGTSTHFTALPIAGVRELSHDFKLAMSTEPIRNPDTPFCDTRLLWSDPSRSDQKVAA